MVTYHNISLLWYQELLGTFSKLQKVNTKFVMSVLQFVCPSAWDNLAYFVENFVKFHICEFLEICWENSSFIKI